MMTFYIVILTILQLLTSGEEKVVIWDVLGESTLEIKGNTNVNSFNCLSKEYKGKDKLRETTVDGTNYWDGAIKVPAEGFDCFNKMMTKDFKETIKANEFPLIEMEFVKMKKSESQSNLLSGEGIVTLANVSKRVDLTCELEEVGNGVRKLVGIKKFLFSDFGIDPPKKFLGTIRVKNELEVEFSILISVAD
ncbi:YceI family protein [Echinicola sp. CAU 1574]|uniref:YceI family protein n=1 Tax=Echinicola arenosa TaxID=2774144 RepID=A0ABR9AEQ1_9BACT|nr:YceI family protein [Echinicola arenosa]MBD8487148.1 YceI family protein [Echinicola arenosa]